MRIRHAIILLLCALLLSACGSRDEPAGQQPVAAGEPADLLLLNGYVYTVDAARNLAQAVAVKDGLIQAVGSDDELRKRQGPETEVIDLAGRTLLPQIGDVLASNGITSAQDAALDPAFLSALKELEAISTSFSENELIRPQAVKTPTG